MAALDKLSRAQLLEIALAGCEASSEIQNRVYAILAAQQRVVEGVLLSSDLLPHVLSSLQLEDGAAAAVCSQWADGWKATSEGRRRLARVPFDLPEDLLTATGHCHLSLAVIPGDDEQLVVQSDWRIELDILARNLSTVASFQCGRGSIVADEQFIYLAGDRVGEVADSVTGGRLRRFTHDGTEVASYEDQEKDINHLVLAPGGLLFCSTLTVALEGSSWSDLDALEEEIIALDAQSLQLRYRFGLGLLNDARGMVVIGEELFVCDHHNDRLQVFSLAGEHCRSITGEWKQPSELCFVKDRIYLTELETYTHHYDEEYRPCDPLCGRRIYVLSLQGDTLQVYPIDHMEPGSSLVCFDGKLLVQEMVCQLDGIGRTKGRRSGLIALCGV